MTLVIGRQVHESVAHAAAALIAGATIVIGLPLGRLRRPCPSLERPAQRRRGRASCSSCVWDVLSARLGADRLALAAVHEHTGGMAPVFGYGVLFAAGLAPACSVWSPMRRDLRRASPAAGRRPRRDVACPNARTRRRRSRAGPSARRLALLIAVGIGLHNFAEGLAIGQSAASGEIALATLLVIGFGLHNATEGFGIVAPLAGDSPGRNVESPSWRFLRPSASSAGARHSSVPWSGTGSPARQSAWSS